MLRQQVRAYPYTAAWLVLVTVAWFVVWMVWR